MHQKISSKEAFYPKGMAKHFIRSCRRGWYLKTTNYRRYQSKGGLDECENHRGIPGMVINRILLDMLNTNEMEH